MPARAWAGMTREVRSDGAGFLNHGQGQGDFELREAIARHAREHRGVRANAGQVIVGAGSEYLLSIAARLTGQGIAVENPGYKKTLGVLQNAGADVRAVLIDEQGMSPKELEKSGCMAAYVTPSHQFPPGFTMPALRRAELLRWARQSERMIIEDDYDSEFRFEGRPIPALQGLEGGERVIYLSTFSKTLAPGIRVAYMVLPERLMPTYLERFGQYSSTVSSLVQSSLALFMERGPFACPISRLNTVYQIGRASLRDRV